MSNIIFSASFFGYTPNSLNYSFNESSDVCANIKNTLFTQICELYKNGVQIFYTSCFLGIDMWAAEIVLNLQELEEFKDIQLVCCIPYEEQAATWPTHLRDRYYTILEQSACNIYIKRRYTKDCILRTYKFMVQHSHFLIALCNDKTKTYESDFANYIIDYAINLHKGVIFINPHNANITPITITSIAK